MIKNFVDLCKSEKISVEQNDTVIKQILKDAMVINVSLVRKSDQSQRRELAAALAWAQSRLSDHDEWELLPVPLQKTLQGLYHIREDLKRSNRWIKVVASLVAAHLTPPPSPVKITSQASVGRQGRVCKSSRAQVEQEPSIQPQQLSVASSVSKSQNSVSEHIRAEWTLSPPYKPPVDYQWCKKFGAARRHSRQVPLSVVQRSFLGQAETGAISENYDEVDRNKERIGGGWNRPIGSHSTTAKLRQSSLPKMESA